MNALDFLQLILPSDGVIFTATQTASNKGWANTSHSSIESAVEHVNKLTFEHRNAFYALSTYNLPRIWNEALKKWQMRTQANTKYIKCLFLDLDIGQEENKFPNKEAAVKGLIAFTKKLGLPRPMVVDSGGGIHAYWPFTEHIPTSVWKPIAEKFKAICLHENFNADRSLTSDEARVLRVPGGYNGKRAAYVRVLIEANGAHPAEYFAGRFDQFISAVGPALSVPATSTRKHTPVGPTIPGAPTSAFGALAGDLGETNDPLHFDRITFACAQMGAQAACRGAGIGEKLWHAAIGIVKFCEPIEPAYRAVSDQHKEYSEAATVIKIANWSAGPTTCTKFHGENPATCEACPHWQSITSPAQLGRVVREAAAPTVTSVDEVGVITTTVIPDPPAPYKRRKDGGIVIESEDRDGVKVFIDVCPYDLYPLKILRQTGGDASVDERSLWRVHLPRQKPFDFDIQMSMIPDARKLHGHLASKGIYMQGDEAKATQSYMNAYLQTMAAGTDRELLYERMGWSSDNNAFVLGNRVLYADGTSAPHTPTRTISAVTKGGVAPCGTLDGWKDTMQFYAGPGYEGTRFFLYAALGAPLFHMTGHKGVLVTSSGESGRGKTTCLMSCASIWGNPDSLILNGNRDGSTVNAFYETLGTFSHLPLLWDDTTERTPEEIRGIMLNLPQGRGKIRMKGHEMVERMTTWATIVLGSTNSDNINGIMASAKDVSPHLMRTVNVDFGLVDTSTEAKIRADKFIRGIKANHGHAGPILMQKVVRNYAKAHALVETNMAKVDRLCASSNASAERVWTATIAAAYTAAQLAKSLGLITFDIEADLAWMVATLAGQRDAVASGVSTAQEELAEFLDQQIYSTMILSAKQASTLDNIVLKPHNGLTVRHELDTNVIHVSRSAIQAYCADKKMAFRRMEVDLIQAKVIVESSVQKILGSGTPYAKGQVRCWKIDASKLSGVVTPETLPAVIAQVNNVMPIGKRGK